MGNLIILKDNEMIITKDEYNNYKEIVKNVNSYYQLKICIKCGNETNINHFCNNCK